MERDKGHMMKSLVMDASGTAVFKKSKLQYLETDFKVIHVSL